MSLPASVPAMIRRVLQTWAAGEAKAASGQTVITSPSEPMTETGSGSTGGSPSWHKRTRMSHMLGLLLQVSFDSARSRWVLRGLGKQTLWQSFARAISAESSIKPEQKGQKNL